MSKKLKYVKSLTVYCCSPFANMSPVIVWLYNCITMHGAKSVKFANFTIIRGRYSSFSITTGYGLDVPTFESRWRERDSSYPTTQSSRPTQLLVKGYRSSFLGGRVAGFKNGYCTPLPIMAYGVTFTFTSTQI